MTHTSAAFFAAFNDIEQHLRSRLNAKNSDSFWWMADRAVERHILSGKQAETLKDYSNLRNAIAHGRYYDGDPIAEPHPRVVESIEGLRDLLINPPTAFTILGGQDVAVLAPDAPISQALSLIAQHDFSQIPIYENGSFLQLLTTNVITRWVAADLEDNNQLDAVTVREVLAFGEPADRAVFLDRRAIAQEAIDALTNPAKDGTHAFAAVMTEHGKKNQTPIRIITPSDLSELIDAVEWE